MKDEGVKQWNVFWVQDETIRHVGVVWASHNPGALLAAFHQFPDIPMREMFARPVSGTSEMDA